MIQNFTDYLNENIDIKKKLINKTIVFSDIVKSSEKWLSSPDNMIDILENFSKKIDKYLEGTNGFIVKSIGDAYMFSFDSLYNAINFSIQLQKYLKENPYKIKNEAIDVRIGICSGQVYEAETEIQKNKLKDYLGNTVNTASRIESKVCENGDVAFSYMDDDEVNLDKINDLLEKYDVDVVSFTNTGDEILRSGRLIDNIQRYYYKNVDDLKGVDELNVYKIKI